MASVTDATRYRVAAERSRLGHRAGVIKSAPARLLHAWESGAAKTVCGVPLVMGWQSPLYTFPELDWADSALPSCPDCLGIAPRPALLDPRPPAT